MGAPAVVLCSVLLASSAAIPGPAETIEVLRSNAGTSLGQVGESAARGIVVLRAGRRWAAFSLGPSVFCCDDDGELVAYMIPVRIGPWPFPPSCGLGPPAAAYAPGKDGGFYTYVVSARRTDFPVPCEFDFLPPPLVAAGAALRRARDFSGGDVSLLRYDFLGHRGEYFEFASPRGRLLVNAGLLTVSPPAKVLVRRGEPRDPAPPRWDRMSVRERRNLAILRTQAAEAWRALDEQIGPEARAGGAGPIVSPSSAAAASDHYIPSPEAVANYDWTRGCSPTAAAMALSYGDNLFKNFGFLVRWYRRRYEPVTGRANEAPQLIDQLADAMATDRQGGTPMSGIRGGITAVANGLDGYGYTSSTVTSFDPGDGDDWCWGRIAAEVRAGRPFVWTVSASFSESHSMAAIGFTDDKMVIVRDPNAGTTPPLTGPPVERRWRYNYYEYDNARAYVTQVDTVERSGGYPSDVKLISPRGGETASLGAPFAIRWRQSGTGIVKVRIFYSPDSGNTWRDTGRFVRSAAGVNSYAWVPEGLAPRTTGRIRIRGCDAAGTARAADGSAHDFELTPAPLVPPDLSSPAPGAAGLAPAVTLRWTDPNSSPQETGYQVRLGATTGEYAFYSVPPDGVSLALVLTAGASFRWNVRALGDGRTRASSSWAGGGADRTFTIARASLIAPAPFNPPSNAPAVSSPVTFAWSDPNRAPRDDGYEVRVAAGSGEYSYYRVARGETRLTLPLDGGIRYRWNVRAVGDGRTTDSSAWGNAGVDRAFTTARIAV